MTDDFLREVQIGWRGIDVASPQDMAARMKRTRLAPFAFVAAEIAGGVTAVLIGLWFAVIAVQTGRLVFVLSAAVVLSAIPAFTFASVMARRDTLSWADETPEGVLRYGLRRAKASLAAVRLGWWGIGVIALFVAVLWIAQLGGWLGEAGFVLFYTVTSLMVVGVYALWLLWRRSRLDAERAACERLLGELLEPPAPES
jgi:Na+/melibiose symporter-like transporter